MDLQIILLEPIYEGNVGSVARVMKNFGFENLVLVNPCLIEDFGWAMASHAKDVLERAKIVSTLDEATADANLIVGTTGKISDNNQKHLRLHLRVPYLSPKELSKKLESKEGVVALLLGREDRGLSGQELAKCDMVVSIPTSQIYPIMNISHAAAILFYELSHIRSGKKILASHESLWLLQDKIKSLLNDSNYPAHKIDYTVLMFKRVIGRSELTEREARTMLGVIKRLNWQIRRVKAEH